MDLDQVRAWLRLWGREYGERAADFDDIERDAADVHPLAVARHYAPGSRTAVALASRRDGSARRRYMARELAACGIRAVPVTFVDPVAGTASRPKAGTPRFVTAPEVPRMVIAIQSHVMAMVDDASTKPHGLALQAWYCIRGAREDKRLWMAARLGKSVTDRAYRAAAEQGTLYLWGRLSSPLID